MVKAKQYRHQDDVNDVIMGTLLLTLDIFHMYLPS